MCALSFGLYARVGCTAPGLQFAGRRRMAQSGQFHVVGYRKVRMLLQKALGHFQSFLTAVPGGLQSGCAAFSFERAVQTCFFDQLLVGPEIDVPDADAAGIAAGIPFGELSLLAFGQAQGGSEGTDLVEFDRVPSCHFAGHGFV